MQKETPCRHWLLWLWCLTTTLTLTSGSVTIDRLCPANNTVRGEAWSPCWFPDIITNQRGCGRNMNETWAYRLCDPNNMMTPEDAWAVEEAIRDAEMTSPYTCHDVRDARKNFTYGFAVIDSILIPDLSSPDRCINQCGAILPILQGRQPTEEEINVAMETLAKSIRSKWRLGVCSNDIITIYCRQYQKAITVAGSKASALTPSKLRAINAGAVNRYFKRDELRKGLQYLVSSYKQSLLGLSPAYILLIMTGVLLVFVAVLLYYIFNIGRELTTLYDESIPTSVLKAILYGISLVWLIKGWLMMLGWILEEPKVRFGYIMAPLVLTMIGILFAWLSAPQINAGYEGYGSSY